MVRFSKILIIVVVILLWINPVNALAQDSTRFKPIVQVFGRAVFDLDNEAEKLYGFSFDRAHIGFSMNLASEWSAKVIIDRGRPTTVGSISVLDSSGQQLSVQSNYSEGAFYTMALKFATLEWKPSEKFRIQGGAVLQNHYITQERFWGLRYIAETFQDRYFKTPSSDLGFIAYYNISKKWSLDFALTNGEGFRSDQDAFGKIKLAGGVGFKPTKNFETRIFYDYKKTGDTIHSGEEQTVSFFAGYKKPNHFRIGVDANYRINHQHYRAKDIYGFTVFAAKQIANKTEFFLRYDQMLEGTANTHLLAWKNYVGPGKAIIGGIHFVPANGVALSVNYQGWFSDIDGIDSQHRILLAFEYKF